MTMDEGTQRPIVIDVWSDVMCPFCYMGDALLTAAIDAFEHPASVVVRYRSYQLMPHLPREAAVPVEELLVREKGIPRTQAAAMHAQVAARGKQLGLAYQFDKVLAVNTRAAHRLSHFAKQHGKQHALMRRLFEAYFTEGLHIGKDAVLSELAAEVGLDPAAALDVLASGAFDDAVTADVEQAREMGIQGVPFFLFDGKHAVSGAQPVNSFAQALDAAWKTKE